MPRGRATAARRQAKTQLVIKTEVDAADAVAAAQAVADADEPPSCSVCLEELSEKRHLRLKPCDHVFHRTCVFEWLETRTIADEQVCPLCRTIPNAITPHMGTEDLHMMALGSTRAPTKNLVIRLAMARSEPVERVIACLLATTTEKVSILRGHVRALTSLSPKSEFRLDAEKELMLMKARVTIFNEMVKLYDDGGMRLEHLTVVTEPWDYRRELYDLRKRQYHAERATYEGHKKLLEASRTRLDTLYQQIQSLRDPPPPPPPVIELDDEPEDGPAAAAADA
ncbi:hypothetical protein PFISCL1PPCAC_9516, partial [Pristionchus fissidentatus]